MLVGLCVLSCRGVHDDRDVHGFHDHRDVHGVRVHRDVRGVRDAHQLLRGFSWWHLHNPQQLVPLVQLAFYPSFPILIRNDACT